MGSQPLFFPIMTMKASNDIIRHMNDLGVILDGIWYKISPTQNIFTDMIVVGVWLGVFVAAIFALATAVFLAKLISKKFFTGHPLNKDIHFFRKN